MNYRKPFVGNAFWRLDPDLKRINGRFYLIFLKSHDYARRDRKLRQHKFRQDLC